MGSVIATIYNASHCVVGEIETKQRLQEVLNDSLTDYLELTDARSTAMRATPDRGTIVWARSMMPKAAISVVTVEDPEQREPSEAIAARALRAPKAGLEACALVDGLEVFGRVHLDFDGPVRRVLVAELAPFFPLTNAALAYHDRPIPEASKVPLALVNRDRLQAFSLL